MSNDPLVVYVAGSAEQAHLLAGALRDRGFEALVTNDGLQLGLGALPFGVASAPRIVVPAAEAEEARRIVLDLMGEKPHEPQPSQFRLRTLLYVITAISVYLGIDRLTGWRMSGNLVVVFYFAIGAGFLGEIVCNAFRKRKQRM